MKENPVAIFLGILLLIIVSFGLGFAAGRHYERENTDSFNLRIDEEGVRVNKKNQGRIVAPFVDIEYDAERK